ncbi:MAG: fibronectin/fibrinogen-binding protein [Syntrophomonadaceae bacterium]|nr:fibronectin/fibrinogen-binding protein [Syntrophomonadaceae bacterium]
MPFDGMAIRAVCQELDRDLNNARIDKIHQPEKDEIVFLIRAPGSKPRRLLISANPRWARIHCCEQRKENPSNPPAFCMLLRKYLEGGKIKAIKQVDFERIVHIYIEALDEFREWKTKLLVCEFMGRHSNIILINPETQIILDAIKKYGSDLSSYREVLPGKNYISPPDQGKMNPLSCSFSDFVQLMWQQEVDSTLASALFKALSGISPFSAGEICQAAGINPDVPVEECGEFEFSSIFKQVQKTIAAIDYGQFETRLLYKNNQLWEFVISPPSPPALGGKSIIYPSANSGIDTYYQQRLDKIRLDSSKTNITRTIKSVLDKAYRKRFMQEGDKSKALENEKYKTWGELLTSYAHQFQKGDTVAQLEDFYSGETVNINLDPRYTPIQNAQKYFKIYNKSRSALKHLENLMARNQQDIDYLESVLVAIKQAESMSELDEIIEELEKEDYLKEHGKRKKQQQRSEPRTFISSDGLEIMVGRNNRQNDVLTLKQARGHDLWLHAKDIPGTHVIIKLPPSLTSINDVPDKSLEEAANLAAHFSKAQESSKVPVDYTFRANVRKPGGARPGMVIYDNYWTIMADPHEARISEE